MARLGAVVAGAAGRVAHLQAAVDALLGASAWGRPSAFLGHLDPDTAAGTLRGFRPAVPTTGEGVAYAMAGLAAALLFHRLVLCPAARRLARGWGKAPRPLPEKPLAPGGA